MFTRLPDPQQVALILLKPIFLKSHQSKTEALVDRKGSEGPGASRPVGSALRVTHVSRAIPVTPFSKEVGWRLGNSLSPPEVPGPLPVSDLDAGFEGLPQTHSRELCIRIWVRDGLTTEKCLSVVWGEALPSPRPVPEGLEKLELVGGGSPGSAREEGPHWVSADPHGDMGLALWPPGPSQPLPFS